MEDFMSIAIMSAIFFCVIPLMLFHGPSEGGYLYGKVPHSVLSVCVWITSILTSILLSVCLFALLQKMQQDYVKKEDVKKYTIINLLIIVPIAICLVLSELYDPLYGFLTDSHLKNIVTILFISYLTIFIVFYAISIHKSIKAWKAQKEEESKQSQE
jgi:small-conductance mechanosensitive channel